MLRGYLKVGPVRSADLEAVFETSVPARTGPGTTRRPSGRCRTTGTTTRPPRSGSRRAPPSVLSIEAVAARRREKWFGRGLPARALRSSAYARASSCLLEPRAIELRVGSCSCRSRAARHASPRRVPPVLPPRHQRRLEVGRRRRRRRRLEGEKTGRHGRHGAAQTPITRRPAAR